MNEPILVLATAAASLAGLAIVAVAMLKGWHGWLELQRMQLSGRPAAEPSGASPAARIELADLKERIRKLEAIAAGVDL